jgi:predicted O-methyltransferase YrrM
MKLIRFTCKFLVHFLFARHTRGHGVHSPYLYQFLENVVYDKSSFYIFPKIEALRRNLKNDERLLNVIDFGTGKDGRFTIADIAKNSLKSAQYGQMLFKAIHFSKSINVLELGTSLGLTTSYLASVSSNIRCITLEGSPEIATVANDNFNKLQFENIKIIVGNIDNTLNEALKEFEKLDFIFIDANHRLPEVYGYFEQCLSKVHNNTILVFDDIYWSADMEKAWSKIKNHELVTSTFDLFQLGIVFFRPDLYKKHYKIRF